MVDGKNIRNRSHAIESLILSSLKPKLTTAVILAGGSDKQNNIAALKKIDDEIVIAKLIEHLSKSGISQVVVCAGQNQEKIKEALANFDFNGSKIAYVKEKTPMGTAGAIKLASKYLTDQPFLVFHADILTDIDVSDLVEFHIESGGLATIAVKPRLGEKKHGHAYLQGNQIVKFKQNVDSDTIGIINTGIYILSPEVLDLIPKNRVSKLEGDIFPKLAERRQLSAFVFQGVWEEISEK